MKKVHSVAKVIGTTVTVVGAIVTTLYKGPNLDLFHGQGRQSHNHNSTTSAPSEEHWVTGTLLLLARCGGWSSFFVLQVTIFYTTSKYKLKQKKVIIPIYISMELINLLTNNPRGSQSFTLKMYPAELSLTAWICFMGALEGAVVTLVMERSTSVWAIGLDSRLLAAAYSVSNQILQIFIFLF